MMDVIRLEDWTSFNTCISLLNIKAQKNRRKHKQQVFKTFKMLGDEDVDDIAKLFGDPEPAIPAKKVIGTKGF